MFARRLAIRAQSNRSSISKVCRPFCYSNLNFSSAFIAFKINRPDQSIKVQFNLPEKSFEMELDSTNSLKDIEIFLLENKFCK